ncbi:SAM-dependent methyltransferase [Sphingomonas abaci]|uniref:SAM-dependent methyltransferase n=1 Tax=Sphingomonas abaci TaxID=237611 RepID=A0A7W7AHS4_9SPHN|nr:SAM-dependent methyltransferase [Sphingomonas abaci]MBB4617274.1 hypothetical protein [Sphingomonas abaci]
MTIGSKTAAVSELTATATRPPALTMPGSRSAMADPRWTPVCTALGRLRADRRRAVRIVDADCGCGTLLIAALRHARAIGFTAVEGRGIDGSPARIGRARAAAARLHDRTIGIVFEVGDPIDALASEAEVPADIVLWHGGGTVDERAGTSARLAAAGDVVIDDDRAARAAAVAA